MPSGLKPHVGVKMVSRSSCANWRGESSWRASSQALPCLRLLVLKNPVAQRDIIKLSLLLLINKLSQIGVSVKKTCPAEVHDSEVVSPYMNGICISH